MALPRLAIGRPAAGASRFLRHGLLWLSLALGTSQCAALPEPAERPASHALSAPQDTPLGRLAQSLHARAATRNDSGFSLLDRVDTAFAARLALADGARRTLDLQYYAIHADASTGVLIDRLRAAARRGVRVRILLDDFNSAGEDAQVLRLAFEPGISMRLFNPLPGPRGSIVERVLGSLHDMPRLQQRMHNKLFIADNAWGVTGGRNLGDAYFGGGRDNRFVDIDLLAAGPVVRQMSASFDRYWNDPLAYPVQALLSPRDLDRLKAQAPPAPSPQPPPAAVDTPALDLSRQPLTWAPAALLADEPTKLAAPDDPGDDDPGETVVDGLLTLVAQARQEVLLVSPYLVPGPRMMAHLETLRRRGVRVRALTNSLASSDAPAAHAGYARHRPALLALGVELHEMRADPPADRDAGALLRGGTGGSKGSASRASLHAKAVIIDRRITVVGSMNLDLRSHLHNSEVALVVRSPALARQAASQVEASLAGAYRVQAGPGGLRWRAPPGAAFGDERHEPGASLGLRVLVNLLGPLAPDEML